MHLHIVVQFIYLKIIIIKFFWKNIKIYFNYLISKYVKFKYFKFIFIEH